MNKTKVIFASLVLAVSVAAVALTAWANKPMDPFFEANLEALAEIEQPSLKGCVYDPEWHCESLHPTNPELDKTEFYAVWYTFKEGE